MTLPQPDDDYAWGRLYPWSDSNSDHEDPILWNQWIQTHLGYLGADAEMLDYWKRIPFALGVHLYELFRDSAREGVIE